MPSDLASLLREAAPQPGAPVDSDHLWAEGRRRRSRRRLGLGLALAPLAATAAVALVVGTVVLLDGSGTDDAVTSITDDGGDTSAPGGAFTPEEFLPASRDLVGALQDERNAALVGIVGVGEVSGFTPQDNAQVRAATDAAIDRFNDVAAGHDTAPVESAEIPEGLSRLRGDIDGSGRPHTLAETPFAYEIRDGYRDLITVLLDANTSLAEALDDPDLRLASELFDVGLRQTEVNSLLLTEFVLGAGSPDAAWLRRVTELHGEQQRGRASVDELADGTAYEEAAHALDTDLAADGSLDAVSEAIQTGESDLPRLLQSLSPSPDASWPAFLDRVDATMTGD
jgi:hypothetical protein